MERRSRIPCNEKSLRVLHILEATLGGTRQYIEDIAEAIRGHPIRMGLAYSGLRADSKFPRTLERLKELGWATFDVPMARRLTPARDLAAVAKLVSLIRYLRPTIVHCHSAKAGGLGRLAALLSNPRPEVFYSPHALPEAMGRLYMTIERLLGVVTDRFVAVSTSEKEQILSSGIRTTDIDVVWPSINCDYWKPIQRASARESLGIGRDRRVVVGIGRLSHQKDPSTFVRVIGELRARYPDVCGVWVGGGELREQLSDEVTSLDLTANVTVTGWQTDVRPYIAASDLLLSTARYESFGYVVPEALAMERTVVGTDITGTRDILPAVDPILSFQAGDYESASRIILELLDAPARLERIGKAGSRFVKAHFDVDRMSSRISLLYDVSNRGGQKEIVADRV